MDDTRVLDQTFENENYYEDSVIGYDKDENVNILHDWGIKTLIFLKRLTFQVKNLNACRTPISNFFYEIRNR